MMLTMLLFLARGLELENLSSIANRFNGTFFQIKGKKKVSVGGKRKFVKDEIKSKKMIKEMTV